MYIKSMIKIVFLFFCTPELNEIYLMSHKTRHALEATRCETFQTPLLFLLMYAIYRRPHESLLLFKEGATFHEIAARL